MKTLNFSPAKILVMGYLGIILLGCFILYLPVSSAKGISTSFIDALFTATSSVCVTGLITVDTQFNWSIFGKFVILILMQIGGLGYMAMATIIFITVGRKLTIKDKLVAQESFQFSSFSEMLHFIKFVIQISLLIEGIGAVILFFRFIPAFGLIKGVGFSVFHSVSAFCNAGFSLFSSNLVNYRSDLVVNLTITSLIIIGGIGYVVLRDIYHYKNSKHLSLHTKTVITTTMILLITATVFIFFIEYNNPNTIGGLKLKEKLLASYFHAVVPRTAGFNTLDISSMYSSTLFFIIILMFIGASPSGTGGGIKTSTFSTIILTVISTLKGKKDIQVFKRRISQDSVYKSFVVFTLALGFVISMITLLLILEKKDFIRTTFDVVSAFGTVGLSAAPGTSLSFCSLFSPVGKFLTIIVMFVGRVGPLTVAAAMLEEEKDVALRYSEEKMLIG